MKRRLGIVAAGVVLTMAVPAFAQVTRRDHRKKEPPPAATMKVSDWSPKNGPIGTTVVINGDGFSRQTELWFGGSQLKPRRLSEKQITFLVPKSYGDGKIVLRNPGGYEGDYAVGNYAVIMPPEIRGWEPRAGVYGTQVQISGEYFQNGDRVLINGKPIKILSLTADRITCEIPDWATTDFLVVSREGGYESRSRGKFRVLDPQPTIASMSPDYGPPGTTVRINGTHFSDRDRVFYGRTPVRVAQTGNGWIEVVVPERASDSDYFSLRGPGGDARCPTQFNLAVPPSIARYSRGWGSPGDQIDVYGDNFRDGDRLQIGGQWVKIVQIRPGQITIEIPQGAQSGPVVVWRGKDQYPGRDPFDVAYAPTIREWGPETGDYGTRVTLRGAHFDNTCDVFYGGRKLRIDKRDGDHTIEVEIPRGVKDDYFIVRSRYGEAKTGKPFSVYLAPRLEGFRPPSGRPGTQVFLRGDNFTDRAKFLVGSWPAKVVGQPKNGRGIVIEVPDAATEGSYDIWVQDGNYKDNARQQFRVEGYAGLDGIDPWRATYGETIKVSGRNLRAGVKVYIGDRELPVSRWAADGKDCWITIPDGWSGSDWINIDDGGRKVRSSQKFEIYAPAPDVKVRDHRKRGRGRY